MKSAHPAVISFASACILAGSPRAGADQFRWKAPIDGAFASAANWINSDRGGYPAAGDFAEFIGGAYTVTCAGASAGITEVKGDLTFTGGYQTGEYIQGAVPVVLRGAALQGGPFRISDEGSLLVDGSGLTMNGFDFGISTIQTRLRAINGSQIVSSGQVNQLPRPRLESGSTWNHTGALSIGRCYVSGGSVLEADTLTAGPAELDGGRLKAGHLLGSGQAKNGSTITAGTASLGPWLLDGSGTSMVVSGLIDSAAGAIYADISVKAGASLSAGSIADSAWYTVDGSGSQLTVAGDLASGGPQKITVLNQGQGSTGTLTKTLVTVRDPGSLFSFATVAGDSTLIVQNGGRINGGTMHGPTTPSATAGGSISGANSALVLSGDLDLGSHGQGSLDISDGGRVECASAYFTGGLPGGAYGISVYGTGSFFLARSGLVVGDAAGIATLNLGEGGRVEVRDKPLAVGFQAGGEGSVTVDGGLSQFPSALDTRQANETGAGVGGKGLIRIRNRGRVLAGKLTAGVYPGSDGTVEVIGAGTSLETGGTLEIGRDGTGRMTVFSGGLATAQDVLVGSNSGANLLRLTGTDSTLTIAKALRVGNTGTGQLTIQQGARVVLTGTYAEPNATESGLCHVGANAGATGTVTVDGAGSALLGTHGFLNLGLVASGNLTVTGGGEVDFAAISIAGGQNRTSSATISGTGSVVRAADSIGIGAPFPGAAIDEVTVSNGGLLLSRATLAVGKSGILRLNGGSAVAGQTSEAPVPGTAIVANRGLFLLGGRVIGSVVVRQGGTLLPGWSPGHAAIEGNLTMATGTSLEIELGGTGEGTGYDQIEATGTVTLAGHLDIVFRDGFAPANGQVFDLVKAGSVSSNFQDVSLRGLAPGFTYKLEVTGGNILRLTATSPGTAASMPELTINRLPGNDVVVSWPGYVTGWTLQHATSLNTGTWQPVAAPANSYTVTNAEGSGFFRLTSP